MIDLSKKTLLDKLYSYRTDKSSIINDIDNERHITIEKRDNALISINNLEEKLASLTDEVYLLENEGNDLKNNISCFINNEDKSILAKLNIDFDPEDIQKQLEIKLPKEIDSLKKDIEDTKNSKEQEETTINEYIIKIEELSIRHDEAISNQLRLNHFFDLALAGDANFTREELTSLLSNFNLDENEIREASKMLMFPEDVLYEYENNSKKTPIVNTTVKEVIKKEEPKVIETKKEVIIENKEEIEIPEPIIETVEKQVEETIMDIENDVKEETAVTKEYVIEYLKSNEIDYLDFTNNDFEKIVENFDRDLFNKNISLFNEYEFDKDIFSDSVTLFFDKELRDKIELLISCGKKKEDINLNPNILTKYKLSGLIAAVQALKDNGLDPKNVPLMAY